MTLALYGKPRRRQGGLLLLGLLAVLAAMLAGVATFTSAFAHHLDEDIKAPTCADPTWRVKVMTGWWSDYREAVLTTTDNTTPVAMRFSPYIADSDGDIVDASGSGTVHTAGTVTQYTGSFGNPESNVSSVDATATSLTRGSNTVWGSSYQAGTVILWENELMKVTARSGDGLTLTVERGFGDSDPSNHSSSVTLNSWVRGEVEDTTTWDLDFESTSCAGFITISQGQCAASGAPAWVFHFIAPNTDAGSGGTLTVGYKINNGATQSTQQAENGNGAKANWHVTIPFGGANTITIVSAVASGGPAWDGVNGVDGATVSSTACSTPTPTPTPSTPDLTATKTDDASTPGVFATGGSFTFTGNAATDSFVWKIQVRNAGTANARFGFGDVIFRDNLPTNNGLTYSGLTRTNAGMSSAEFNDFSCSLTPLLSRNTIICDPVFLESVDIGPGQGFDITVTATPTSAGTYANPKSDGICKVDPDGDVSESNENNNTCSDTVIGRNPQVIDPTVSKSAHTPAISGGFAYWDIKVDQPASGAAAINGLVIVDSQADVVIDDDGAATCSVNPAGTITCNVPATDVTIVVKRPITASTLSDGTLCLGGHIQNSLVSATLPTGASINITGGGANSPISIPVPPDMNACEGTVSVVKGDATLVDGALRWPITVTNTYPVAKHIIVFDPDSSLLADTETCTNALAENPADYYDCEVGANGTATFTLTTVYPGHTDLCAPLDVTNTAYIAVSTTAGSTDNLGSDSGTFHEDAMPSADCITVAKASVAPHNGGWTITFTNSGPAAQVTLTDTLVPDGTGAALLTMEANGNPVCGSPNLAFPCTVTVPTGGLTIAVTSTVLVAKCEDQTVTNTVVATLGTAPITNTTPNGATQTIKGDPAECEGTVIVKKVNLGPNTSSIQDDEFTYTLSADGSIVGGGTISGDDLDGDSSTETAGKVYTADETDPTAQGYKFLGMKYGYADGGVVCPAWDEGKDKIVAQEPGELSPGGTVVICLYNEPFGTLVINKVDGANGAGGPAWAFTVTGLPAFGIDGGSLDSTPAADQGTPSTQSLIPLGASTLNVTEDLARSIEQCATANTYYTQVIAPADKVIDTPGETVTWTFTNLPCATLGTGGILIEKYNDLNGNGIIDAGEPVLPGWSFTTTGGGIPAGNQVRSTNASGQVIEYVSGFDAGTVLNTTEAVQAGWKLTGVYLDGVLQGTSLSNNVTVIGGKTQVIKFLNYMDPGQIVVTKTIRNNAFPNGANGGAGWTFVLNGCGAGPITATTNSSGVATFSNLPPAINCQYTITEPPVAPWVADDAVQEAAPGAGQSVTVNFVNSFFETCTNCGTAETPTPTATPEQPSSTPTPVDEETPTPTNTPEPAPTTPISQVEGERTPGPGSTPIAPSTGAGAGTTGGMNILLVLAGLMAISGGALVLTFSRKRDR